MSDPVILIGLNACSKIGAIGLYESIEEASDAILNGAVPFGLFYSVHTPPMGTALQPRAISKRPLTIREQKG